MSSDGAAPDLDGVAPERRQRRRSLVRGLAARLLLVLASLAVYQHVRDFGFVHDDHVQLEANPWLRGPAKIVELFRQPLWGFLGERGEASNYYRPLFGVANAVQWRLFDGSPAGFHLVSLLLHVLVVQLAFGVARRLGAPVIAAALGAALFALHPVQAETVSWVAAQGDLLCALALLAALLALLARRGWRWLAPCGYLLACLFKESAVPFVLVVPFALSVARSAAAEAARSALVRMLPFAAALVVYLALRIAALGAIVPRSYGVAAAPLDALRLALAMLGHLGGALVWPFPQRVLFSVGPEAGAPWLVLGSAAAMLAAWALWRWRRSPPVCFAIAWTVAFLLPVLAPRAIGGANFAERYLYLPSLGAAWLAALTLSTWWSRWSSRASAGRSPGGARPRRRLAAAGISAGLAALAALAVVSARRASTYRTDLALFSAAVRSNPRSAAARNNLGAALHAAGRTREAEAELHRGIAIDPGSPDLWSNLGLVVQERGDIGGALAAFERARALAPRRPEPAVALARLLRSGGDRQRAARVLDELLGDGDSYEARCERGLLHLDAHDYGAARAVLEPAVASFPERPRGWYLLAQAWAGLGHEAASERAARAAIARGAGPGPRRLLARLALQRGDWNAARAELDALLAHFPADVEGRRWRDELERNANGSGPPRR